ncbi:MAG TPA: hypothetical protein VGR57_21945 [Ktedonobacterales bacterium]|nr:hypothetical protein [Ktedonobacterales bacterium]
MAVRSDGDGAKPAESSESGGFIVTFLIIAVFAVAATAALAFFFPTNGVYFYGAALLLCLALSALGLIPTESDNTTEGQITGAGVTGACLIYIALAFGPFCLYWNVRFGGFAGHAENYWGWTRFGLSWILDNGLANMGQIFGWNISDIQAIGFGARAITWCYNIALDFIVVASFFRYAPRLLRRRQAS